ncbi:MAG: S-layer homology domain-containing protein, partial [Promicromonosporaceae bacterium]|nr:S-layer homology domain-containing protein [Promicromonosporaceae bacterium]
ISLSHSGWGPCGHLGYNFQVFAGLSAGSAVNWRTGAAGVVGQMSSNTGHRQGVLDSTVSQMGFGSTARFFAIGGSNLNRTPVIETIAFPAAGYFPIELSTPPSWVIPGSSAWPLPAHAALTLWSFTRVNLVSADAQVSITRNGQNFAHEMVPATTGRANTVQWTMNLPTPTGPDGVDVYRVRINGISPAADYEVRVFRATAITGGTATISGTPRLGQTLAAAASGFNPTPDGVTFQWLRNGVVASEGATRTLTAADVGQQITVQATATLAGFTQRQVVSNAVTVQPGTITGGTVTISGENTVGSLLTVSLAGMTPMPSGGQISWQWLRDGTPITGATGTQYRLTAADAGRTITARASVNIPGYTAVTRTSAGLLVMPAPSPSPTPGVPSPQPTPTPPGSGWECPATSSFTDVVAGSQFHCYIAWLAATEITTGWPDHTFRPGANVERQAMAAFLYRGLADSDGFTTPGVPRFADKPISGAFFRQVEWLAGTGITTGWNMGTHQEFRPGAHVERQAMAAFLFRAAGSPRFTPPATATFQDVPVGAPFFREIEWLYSTNITTGWHMGTHQEFRPSANVERQAMAAFLYRAFNNGHLPDAHLNRP